MIGENDFDEDMQYSRLDLEDGYSLGETHRETSISRCSTDPTNGFDRSGVDA